MRDLRFGVMISKVAASDVDPIEEARLAEALGFDLVTVHPDHMHGIGPTLESWTLLSWMAANTTRIRLAPAILSLPYRHPAVTAKMAETLDRLSGGRLILGLGGGNDQWSGAFRAFGLAQRAPREIVEATEEAIDILHGLWHDAPFSYEGKHFHLAEAAIEPRPARPIPIWLGAFGSKMLSLTGRKADGWFPSLVVLEPEAAYAKLKQVRQAAMDAGRDPDDLTYAYNIGVLVTEEARSTRGQIVGTPGEVAEHLAAFVKNGFTFLNLWPHGDMIVQLERLAWEVIPAVRQLVA